jgi:hypothetical protein
MSMAELTAGGAGDEAEIGQRDSLLAAESVLVAAAHLFDGLQVHLD